MERQTGATAPQAGQLRWLVLTGAVIGAELKPNGQLLTGKRITP